MAKGKARDSEVQAALAAVQRTAELIMPPVNAMMRAALAKLRAMPEMVKLTRSQQEELLDLVLGPLSSADRTSDDR